jgi:hypothetical protein
MRTRFAFGLLILGILCVLVTVGWAQEVVVVDFGQASDGVPPGWQLSEKKGKADLALLYETDGQVLRLRSNASSFSIEKQVDVDLKQTPFLVWTWMVTEVPKGGDFRTRVTDDQAGQLLVLFHWGYIRKEAIAYIWDSTAPQGTMAKAPSPAMYPLFNITAVVVRSGETEKGKWITETRNVVKDYKKLFGREPKKVRGIRIQINSQHTNSHAEAYWKSVEFKARP